jgi:hypothetical protein
MLFYIVLSVTAIVLCAMAGLDWRRSERVPVFRDGRPSPEAESFRRKAAVNLLVATSCVIVGVMRGFGLEIGLGDAVNARIGAILVAAGLAGSAWNFIRCVGLMKMGTGTIVYGSFCIFHASLVAIFPSM